MGPVFIFGTGRCGSTHLQRLVSLNTEVWVWGEHDGFLNPLLRALKAYEGSAALRRAVFDQPLPADDATLVRRVRNEGAILSWLNRLQHDSLRRELRQMITRIFTHGVPQGWRGWGFKEILYHGPEDVPATLLDLFPNARAAFTFRAPEETVESMLHAWTPEIVRDPARIAELPPMYDGRAKRWCDLMSYFIALKRVRPDRLALLDMERLNLPARQVLRLLRVPPRIDAPLDTLPPTNAARRILHDEAAQAIAAGHARWGDRMRALYREGLDLR